MNRFGVCRSSVAKCGAVGYLETRLQHTKYRIVIKSGLWNLVLTFLQRRSHRQWTGRTQPISWSRPNVPYRQRPLRGHSVIWLHLIGCYRDVRRKIWCLPSASHPRRSATLSWHQPHLPRCAARNHPIASRRIFLPCCKNVMPRRDAEACLSLDTEHGITQRPYFPPGTFLGIFSSSGILTILCGERCRVSGQSADSATARV